MGKKNSEVVTDETAALEIQNPESLPEFAGWEEEQLAFPPYLNMKVGRWFHALVITLDDRDPEFPRYVLQAETALKCQQGRKEESVDVIVKSGEFFTCSTYTGLPLDRYVGVRVLVRCTGTRDVDRPQPMLIFTLKVSPEDKKLLQSDRKAAAQAAMARFRESRKNPQLPAHQADASA